MRHYATHTTFPLSSRVAGQAHHPRLQSVLCTRALARWNRSKDGGEVCPTLRSDQVLKLTDYHISQHVVSTFKRLTRLPHTTTLANFDYPNGVSQLHNPACCPYISTGIKFGTIPICSREAGNHSTSTVPN